MKYTLMTITLGGDCLAGIVQADLLVEFTLYTSTEWDNSEDAAFDVSMQIDDIDELGPMPYGNNSYNLAMEVTGLLPDVWQNVPMAYDDLVTGWNGACSIPIPTMSNSATDLANGPVVWLISPAWMFCTSTRTPLFKPWFRYQRP